MNRIALIAFASALTACGTLPNEVVPMRDGTLRAATYVSAATYCQQRGSTARVLGKAPAETGVLFLCEKN